MNFENLPEWNYKSEELDDSTEKDRDERPPLKGNTRRIPMGLYEEPWDKVTDAYGSAELTPFYIEGLGSDNKADREFAIFGLYSATTHQGSVYESARMAIPFLVDMLKAEKEDDTILASHFLARIAVGENHFIRSPKYVDRCRSEYFNDVFEFKNILRAFYEETDNPEIMRLLCFYPHELPDYVLPKKKIKDEILATKLIVQGFIAAERNLKEHKTEVEEYMLESDSLLVRLSAAVCLAYSNLADDYCKKLLLHLSEMDLNYTPWVWEFDASQLAKYAWI
ncbi:MAG: hypothetical protein ACPG5P_05755 [Saprospiraceae bacterium]